MARTRKFKPKVVATALKANMGMVYVTARKLGCSHQMIYNYIEQFDECRAAYEEQSGYMVDAAEVKFYEAIQNGESWAINKMLSTKGRSRGYGEKQELDIKGTFTFSDALGMSDAQLLALIASVNGYSNNGHPTLSE